MTAITVGHVTATVPASPVRSAKPAKSQPSLFARAWNAFIRGRMLQAERELARQRHLLPAEFQDAAMRLARDEKALPFVR